MIDTSSLLFKGIPPQLLSEGAKKFPVAVSSLFLAIHCNDCFVELLLA